MQFDVFQPVGILEIQVRLVVLFELADAELVCPENSKLREFLILTAAPEDLIRGLIIGNYASVSFVFCFTLSK